MELLADQPLITSPVSVGKGLLECSVRDVRVHIFLMQHKIPHVYSESFYTKIVYLSGVSFNTINI